MTSHRRSAEDRHARPRRRRQRRSFSLGWVIFVLIVLPLLGLGGYFGYRAIQKSGGLPWHHESKVEKAKQKLIGEWTFFDREHDYLVNLEITDGRLDITATKGGEVAQEWLTWKVESGDDRLLSLALTSPHPNEPKLHWDFEFLSDSEVRITMKGSRYAPRVYTKKGGK